MYSKIYVNMINNLFTVLRIFIYFLITNMYLIIKYNYIYFFLNRE